MLNTLMKLILGIIISSYCLCSTVQANDYFVVKEDSLKNLILSLTEKIHDFERLSINEEFKELFHELLKKEESFYYPFDSLFSVSLLKSPDNSFRIITWYVPLNNGTFDFFGFFQVVDERRDEILIYKLNDNEKASDDLIYKQLSHDNWHGAYYYEIIHTRYNREDFYTLLGWRGDNPLTRKRIIEPIRLAAKGRPVFGIPQFTYDNNRYRRVVFEYSANVNMYLNYESQLLFESRRTRYMIVFDRLEPSHPRLKGHYHFYFPEANIIDAFIFEDGRWVYYPEIDARNP